MSIADIAPAKSVFYRRQLLLVLSLVLVACVRTAAAQTTQFNYQGSLDNNGLPANGSFDLEFKLYDAASGGAQHGTTVQQLNVAVTNGVFTVTLDFGLAVFTEADRFLETSARPAGTSDPFVASLPRPQILSVPYSIRSLNSTHLGSVEAGQYVLTTDPRMSDPRQPLPNSSNYIQNTTVQQPSSNFNISGNGTAGGTLSGSIVNATTQYNLNGSRILVAPALNVFVGSGAGQANSTGNSNSFFGKNAGFSNTTGHSNSFFGYLAGYSNMTGRYNSFFGRGAGDTNTTGNNNSFFGFGTGSANTGGINNSFFGFTAGNSNSTGSGNSFFGSAAGLANTSSRNSFFGYRAGRFNTTGGSNSFVGYLAGEANTTGHSNSFFGTEAGYTTTSGHNNSIFGNYAGPSNTTGSLNTFIGAGAGYSNTAGSNNTMIGNGADVASGNLRYATAIGAGAVVSTSNSVVLGRGADTVRVPGYLIVTTLATGGSTGLCRTTLGYVSTCSSSLRYKDHIQPFIGGLEVVQRLRPITFNWKDGGMGDVGFAAEEVKEVEPLLATLNDKGEVEGVKYGQLTTVLVNAIKEQQAEIEMQQKQIQQQKQAINNLKKLVCRRNLRAEICKEK